METSNFLVKCKEQFSGRKLDLIKLIEKFQPCTIPALIDHLEETQPTLKRPDYYNKLTKELEENEIIIVSKQECSFTNKKSKRPKVFELASIFPDKLKKKPSKTTAEMIRSSLDSALLAIESFNKPNTCFKTENFIILMINAWLKLLHAYLNHDLQGSYREKNVDKRLNRRKTISFRKSLEKVSQKKVITTPAKANLEFCVELRDQIEHSYIRDKYMDVEYYGRFQFMVNNYELFIKENFGQAYLENYSLTFALQFSSVYYTDEQKKRIRQHLSRDAKSLIDHLQSYEQSIIGQLGIDDIARYPISVGIYLKKVNNPEKADAIINILQDGVSDQDCDQVLKLLQTSSDREGWRPGKLVANVNLKLLPEKQITLNYLHPISVVFKIKPDIKRKPKLQQDQTNKKFCFWHKSTEEFLYTQEYVDFLVNLFSNEILTCREIFDLHKDGKYLNYKDYEYVTSE